MNNLPKPLRELALKLTHPKHPAYMRCPFNVFPAWTARRMQSWGPAERKFPCAMGKCGTEEYVAEFDSLNHLVHIPHVQPLEYREAA